jgi:hypothetical protein
LKTETVNIEPFFEVEQTKFEKPIKIMQAKYKYLIEKIKPIFDSDPNYHNSFLYNFFTENVE